MCGYVVLGATLSTIYNLQSDVKQFSLSHFINLSSFWGFLILNPSLAQRLQRSSSKYAMIYIFHQQFSKPFNSLSCYCLSLLVLLLICLNLIYGFKLWLLGVVVPLWMLIKGCHNSQPFPTQNNISFCRYIYTIWWLYY